MSKRFSKLSPAEREQAKTIVERYRTGRGPSSKLSEMCVCATTAGDTGKPIELFELLHEYNCDTWSTNHERHALADIQAISRQLKRNGFGPSLVVEDGWVGWKK